MQSTFVPRDEYDPLELEREESIKDRAHYACIRGDLDELKECIRLGYDFNKWRFHDVDPESIFTFDIRTPLGLACNLNHFEMVKYLVEIGAKINVDHLDVTPSPLLDACKNGNIQLIEYLIAHGADVDMIDRPWTWSLRSVLDHPNAVKLVQCLIDHGANVKARDAYKKSVLHNISHDRHRDVNIDAVRLLIENGADVNAKDHQGVTPIFEAIDKLNFKLIRLFVENGANLNTVYFGGITVLDKICHDAYIYNLDRYLIGHGATMAFNVNVQTLVRRAQMYAMLCTKIHTLDVVRFIHTFTHKM